MSGRSIAKWAAYLIGGVVGASIVAAAAGAIYQAAASAHERRLYPMPGKLVDVGGRRLHIHCLGAGSPAIVLENGTGDSVLEWMSVQPAFARITRVCAYDRAGLGWSDPGPAPRTTEKFTSDLHTLLANAGIASP